MTTQLKDVSKFIYAAGVFGLASAGMVSTANAAVIGATASDFSSATGFITFSEKPVGTRNPVYLPSDYGSSASGAPTVFFGAQFAGQPATIPDGPLALIGNVSIEPDLASLTSPILAGDPLFKGPISILFSENISGVGLNAGFFNSVGSTQITAFRRNGLALGSFTNTATGIEFVGLKTDDGTDQIAGLQLSSVTADLSGFAIDNLSFTRSGVAPSSGGSGSTAVPEPFTIVGTLIGGTAALRMRKKLKSNDKV